MFRLIPKLVIIIMLLAACQPGPATQMASPATSESTASTNAAVVLSDPPASCAVTLPPDPAFVPPAPYLPDGPSAGEFWYGSDTLWTALPASSIWDGLPHTSEGYTQKILWWRKGYSAEAEPQPKLSITGERLDGSPLTFMASRATNAFAADIGQAMLLGVDIPALGCWKITGKYAGAELSFVIRVAP